MTLQNKSWLKSEISRLYLSGDSQENIPDKLNISVGTVINLVNEILKSFAPPLIDWEVQSEVYKNFT